VDAHRSVPFGMRCNTCWLNYRKSSHDLGYEAITKEQHEEYGDARCVEIFREGIGQAPLYITFDLDALDLTIAPAVANPEPFGGFTVNEAVRLLRGVRGLNVIGGNVV
jgi:guanidinopropionase